MVFHINDSHFTILINEQIKIEMKKKPILPHERLRYVKKIMLENPKIGLHCFEHLKRNDLLVPHINNLISLYALSTVCLGFNADFKNVHVHSYLID